MDDEDDVAASTDDNADEGEDERAVRLVEVADAERALDLRFRGDEDDDGIAAAGAIDGSPILDLK